MLRIACREPLSPGCSPARAVRRNRPCALGHSGRGSLSSVPARHGRSGRHQLTAPADHPACGWITSPSRSRSYQRRRRRHPRHQRHQHQRRQRQRQRSWCHQRHQRPSPRPSYQWGWGKRRGHPRQGRPSSPWLPYQYPSWCRPSTYRSWSCRPCRPCFPFLRRRRRRPRGPRRCSKGQL